MENPGQLMRRAKLNRQQKIRLRGAENKQMETVRAEETQHVSHHASYTALMRSHDRMRSRHAGVKG